MSFFEKLNHLQIPLQDILLATNQFSDERNLIAVGGFGKVYRGNSDKHGIIAVKRLVRNQGQGDREFLTEIDMLSSCKHENIVSLHGFCNEASEKILVYKYERNGSLDKHINREDLNWTQRLQICLDAARGLKYLHDDVGPQHRIIHRDIKTSNILLDENMRAKISDFGLSKIGPANVERTFLISNACGTIGYVDPEYYETAVLTKESDVFSFGVVLFEILCGRLACVEDEPRLSPLARMHYESDTLDEIIPSYLQIKAASLTKFSNIAYQCLRKRKERPTMTKVVERLQKAMDDQLAPSGPLTDVYDGVSVEDTTNAPSGPLTDVYDGVSVEDTTNAPSGPLTDVYDGVSVEDTTNDIVDYDFAALHQGQTGLLNQGWYAIYFGTSAFAMPIISQMVVEATDQLLWRISAGAFILNVVVILWAYSFTGVIEDDSWKFLVFKTVFCFTAILSPYSAISMLFPKKLKWHLCAIICVTMICLIITLFKNKLKARLTLAYKKVVDAALWMRSFMTTDDQVLPTTDASTAQWLI